jgi:ribosome maturation factor RimP
VVDPLEQSVTELLVPLGYEVVEFRKVGTPERPVLQVRIDTSAGVSSDDCVRASRALEQSLEGRGLVGPRYTLEVSSPGSDRPLKTAADWRRFIGQRVKVKHQAVQGSVYGTIESVDDISAHRVLVLVRREDGEETMELDLAQMREARLAPDLKPAPKPGKTARRQDGKTAKREK